MAVPEYQIPRPQHPPNCDSQEANQTLMVDSTLDIENPDMLLPRSPNLTNECQDTTSSNVAVERTYIPTTKENESKVKLNGGITLIRSKGSNVFTESTITEPMTTCRKCTYITMPKLTDEQESEAEDNGGPIAIAQSLATGQLGSGFQIPSQRHLPIVSEDAVAVGSLMTIDTASHVPDQEKYAEPKTRDDSKENKPLEIPEKVAQVEVDGLQEYKEQPPSDENISSDKEPQIRLVFPCSLHQVSAEKSKDPKDWEDEFSSEDESSVADDWSSDYDSSSEDEMTSENDWNTEEEWTTDNDEPIISPQLNMLRNPPLLRKYPHESESDSDVPEIPMPDNDGKNDQKNPEDTLILQQNQQQGSLISEVIKGLTSLNNSSDPNKGQTQEHKLQRMPNREIGYQLYYEQEKATTIGDTVENAQQSKQLIYPPQNHTNPFKPEYYGSQGLPNTRGESQYNSLEVARWQPINSQRERDNSNTVNQTVNWPLLPQPPKVPSPKDIEMDIIRAGLMEGDISSEFNYYKGLHSAMYCQISKAKVIKRCWTRFTHDSAIRDMEETVEEIKNLNAEIKDSYRKIQRLYKAAIKDDPDDDIQLPTFGHSDKLEIVKFPKFDNTTTSDNESLEEGYYCANLYQYWCKISQYVSAQGISERGTKLILALSLDREPLDIFLRNKDKPVKEIILQLKERYGSFPTPAEYEDILASFRRENGEPITVAMNRFEFIIRNVYKGDSELEKIVEIRCRNTVKEIARPHALEVLARREAEAGNRPFTYQQRLKIIKEEEKIIERSRRSADTMGQQRQYM